MALPTRLARAIERAGQLEPFNRDFDQLVNRLFNGDGNGVVTAGYAVDIWETPDHLHLEAELPGFNRDQIDVTIDNNVLSLTAARTQQEGHDQREWLLNERRAVRFSRSFNLPPTVDGGKVEAKYENGVLHVTLAKREESKPRKISVG
jgi:HSP20 family protein